MHYQRTSRRARAQSGGGSERPHHILEDGLHSFGSLSEFVAYHNEKWLRWFLDTGMGEIPLQALHNKKASNTVMGSNPKWTEKDTNDEAKSFSYNTL